MQFKIQNSKLTDYPPTVILSPSYAPILSPSYAFLLDVAVNQNAIEKNIRKSLSKFLHRFGGSRFIA